MTGVRTFITLTFTMSQQEHRRQSDWEDEDVLAYKRNDSAFQRGISMFEIHEYYSQYCHQYEEDLRPGRYNGPRIAADAVARYYPRDTDQKKIIDIAAGTGFVAENLKARGFQHIDALEPSASMIAMAKKKGLYETYYENVLTDDPLNIASDTYDCAVSSGGFGEGHIPCSGIKELIRITKPGGVICIVMRQRFLVDVEEYKDRLVPLMLSLEKTGKWERVSRHVVQNYFIDLPGVVFLYTIK